MVVEVCGTEEQEALREYEASERDGQNEEAKEEMVEANVSGLICITNIYLYKQLHLNIGEVDNILNVGEYSKSK